MREVLLESPPAMAGGPWYATAGGLSRGEVGETRAH